MKKLGEYFGNLDFDYANSYSGLRGEKIKTLSNQMDTYNSRVIDREGTLHDSATLIHRFEKGTKETADLLKVLNKKRKVDVVALCPPTFRDAIVFYSKENKINGILQICFQCLRIENESGEYLELDGETFYLLACELVKVGHPIENLEALNPDGVRVSKGFLSAVSRYLRKIKSYF